ncbi:hypothetical protein LRM36_12125 [Stenotrophomonas maltophilia]|uniref:Uncharacterized protein n=4 Tax=Gammaproteobacteria TaxID=1236 RepID=A0ABM7R541_9GAMM|nr:hypothetical protein [Stenotrophomonas pavanii]MCW8340449.1 hypothetical protein [Stenotrophomonas sp. SG1]MDA3304251.1 hypothetical protein [Stenotrophomonas sp. PI_27]MDA5339159.1 hypothetical protein [Stenotrophomonas maltophilia]MDQ7274304.1 hypothetical protein [Stenotrophomonas sp. Sm3212]MDQ7277867.1 hypothetical protein [Stenotrophomonas sp. Sm3147]MDQ7286648.1 hypothetical protein [Stenotrophomonas sp. Sm5341]
MINIAHGPGRRCRCSPLRPGCAADVDEEDAMLFAVEELESEICKLRGLLQMLHEDQPDVLEDVFEFHVGSLISHASPEHHPRIRACAQEMLAAIRALPRRRGDDTPVFRVMPQLDIRPA